MKKLALLLALLMIVGCFAACGGDSEKNQTTEPAATGGNAANQPAATNGAAVADPEHCPDSADGKHQYTEEVAGEPSCTLPGLMMYTCSACQFSTTKEIPALGHQGTGASCVEPSICTVCGEVAENAWGHDPEGGICRQCGEEVTENGEEKPTEEAEEEVDAEATEEATVA